MVLLMDASRAHEFAAMNTHSLFHERTHLGVRLALSLGSDPEIISFCTGPGAEARTAHTAQ